MADLISLWLDLAAPLRWLLVGALAWLIIASAWWIVVVPWLKRGPDHDPTIGFLWRIDQLLARLIHRARFAGREHVPESQEAGPLIVISNHTGAVDPLLIQAACPFKIRWMMATETMLPSLARLWTRIGIIPVTRTGKDSGPAREAMRAVQRGEVIGIFPEGGIVTPPEQIWPFFTGAGLIIAKTRAPVLLCWVSGTPRTSDMMTSLVTPSRSRVEFIGIFDFAGERDPEAISAKLRAELARVSGWPLAEGEAKPRYADHVSNDRR